MAPPCRQRSSLTSRVVAGLGLVLLATWPSRQSSRTRHWSFFSVRSLSEVESRSADAEVQETRDEARSLPRDRTPWRAQSDFRRQSGSRREQRGPRRPVRITHVGQRLFGTVLNVGHVRSGAAMVDVKRGRPCLLLPMDFNGTTPEVGQRLVVFVKQIVRKDDHVLLSLVKPKRDVFSLRAGEQLRGKVTHVDPGFGGIFLDVGARKDGMLLPGQLTQEFNESLSGKIETGMELDVFVKDVRQADCTFSLTMFRPRIPVEKLEVGQKLEGVIRKLPSFGGAFVDVGAERDGWLSDWELREGPLENVQEGMKVIVWVQELTREKGLQLTLAEPRLQLTSLLVGGRLKGEITGTTKYGGVFVDVGAVRDGIVHKADLLSGVDLEVGSEVTVWVKQRKFEGSLQLTMKAPTKTWKDLAGGKRVQGRITGINNQGGAFVDVGWVNDALLRFEEMSAEVQNGPPEVALPVGHKVDLWVQRAWAKDGRIDLTMLATPAATEGSQTPERRGIV